MSLPTTAASDQDGARPVVLLLLLVGVQGAGKSFFSQRVLSMVTSKSSGEEGVGDEGSAADAPVAVINQDELGSRNKCMAALRQALTREAGPARAVVIDRMNLTAGERSHFIEFTKSVGEKENIDVCVHCLVFDIPLRVCVQRIKSREHGTVSGSKCAHFPNSSRMKYEPPKLKPPLLKACGGAGKHDAGGEAGEDVDFISCIAQSGSAFDSAVSAYVDHICGRP